mmetsp:Transcript_71932/g.136875  ORF Transcript_71932/g.136875 Transcript_71932/m.136875 type:complete len:752 (+) Transcript_71932:98-2353(+)
MCFSAFSKKVLASAPVQTDESTRFAYEGPGPWHTCAANGEVLPRVAKRGIAGPAIAPSTLPEMLKTAATGTNGGNPALKVERPLPQLVDGKPPAALADEDWTTWSYADFHQDARTLAKAFVSLKFAQFDSVNVWGFNSPEWFISAYAASFAGGKCAGLYPTDTPDTAAYKVVHSGGSVVVVEDRGKLNKLVKALDARGDASTLKAFIIWGEETKDNDAVSVKGCGSVPILSWSAAKALGNKSGLDAEIDARIAATKPGHCAALIYTSGTTGEPKAVMISHDNFIFEASCVVSMLKDSVGFANTPERIVSYLPLSHVAGMMVDIVTPTVVAAQYPIACTVYFARPYDLKVGSIKDRLVAAKPTIFLGVPLVWEKIADRIKAIGASVTGVKKKLAAWGKGLGLQHAHNCQLGGSGSYPCGYGLASKLILSKIKANLGLDQLKFAFTGAAPIRVDTLEYFGSLGLQINEVYGMSECTGATTISMPEAHQWGSCGFELPGSEVKVFLVDDKDFNKKKECELAPSLDNTDEKYQGELCFRGRNIMMGYMAQPDLGQAHVAEINKKTAETIDSEGWLHSGDKGMITVAGMCKITGRYKELIIGEGGENIAPIPIEDHVKKMCDGIAEIMMVGDKRKYNIALITLKAVGANGEVPGTDQLDAGAARVNPDVKTITEAMKDKVWIDALTAAITSANNNGKVCFNNAAKIQKFTILPLNFSEQNNELTPTKKLKRKVVEGIYKDTIEKLYATDGTYIPSQ